MKTNIVLVGLMGAGKTRTARQLAKILHKKCVSTDAEIEQREGRSIADIFRDSGEEYFRKLEKETVRQIALEDDLIVDCGGGIVLDPDNILQLKKKGIVFYLYASPDVIHRRTRRHTHRPLLNVPDPLAKIKTLLEERQAHYEQADHTIDTDRQSVEQTVEEVLKKLPHD